MHDAFRKALEEPKIASLLDRFDQPAVYMSAEDYTKLARQTYETEKATAERSGLKRTMQAVLCRGRRGAAVATSGVASSGGPRSARVSALPV